MELGHLLAHSGLTYPEVSSDLYDDSFCQLGSSVSLPWVMYFEAFYLHVVSSFSCIPVICPKFVFTVHTVHIYWKYIIVIINIIIISVMELGHLLTRSGLTYPEVSSKVYHDSFCQLDSSVSLPWVIHFEAFYLHAVSSFSCIPVICPKLVLFLTPLQFVHLFCNLSQVYPAVLLMYFISAAVILLASLALIVQVLILIFELRETIFLFGINCVL